MLVVADEMSALKQLVEMKLEGQEYVGYDDWIDVLIYLETDYATMTT